jgi:hypothetical protein
MSKNPPKEDFNDLAADLALCIADAIEHPDCPGDLADALRAISDEVQNAISPSCSELLRALAGLSRARHTAAYPKPGTPVYSRPDANLTALAKASVSQSWQSC